MGTGLGLSTVYAIMEQNRGFITVESEPGMGTGFFLFFPIIHGEPETEKISKTPVSSCNGTECILVVEDEEAVRTMISRVLKRRGYSIIGATNGAEALSLVGKEASEISLLITDMIMPEMNGYELSKRLEQVCPGIVTLFISGHLDEELSRKGYESISKINFINKPFSAVSLENKVREILDNR